MIDLEIKRLKSILEGSELKAFNAIFGQWFITQKVQAILYALGLQNGFKSTDVALDLLQNYELGEHLLRYCNYIHLYLTEMLEHYTNFKNDDVLPLILKIRESIEECLALYLKHLKSLSSFGNGRF